jgi:hypothetical protein
MNCESNFYWFVLSCLCLPMSAEYELKYITYAFQQIAILGYHRSFRFLEA